MICPKCTENSLRKIKLKDLGRTFLACDFCASIWDEDRVGLPLTKIHGYFTKEGREEYGFRDIDLNQDNKSVFYPHLK